MQKNSPIEFIRTKDYKYVEEIGQGGTGRTILIRDEIIDENFVCKKYSPYYEDDIDSYYDYFKGEIKILHTIYHKNIVRIFNYYLYPEQKTGYILMEHIKGKTIIEYLLLNPNKINDIFIQIIDGFGYLEDNNILHRDIRPENILISDDGIVKIIDFGFGKFIDFKTKNKSITLNWRYTTPDEFKKEIYDTKTEIYFIGKMFEEIITEIENIKFKYSKTISKMISPNYENRISTFFEVYRDILSETSNELEFIDLQKMIYQNFANNLTGIISSVSEKNEYRNQIDIIIRKLEELHKNSILENEIQNNNKLISIFMLGKYSFFSKKVFKVELLFQFIHLLKSVSEDKRKVILNNLWERFDTIEKKYETMRDDLPF
ncbi:protein kinase family protein [Flavobacterium sufflavum]|uniref:Protein kinase family protein n=1 Tax=Flavobacterium sufflavum TaxID=1921138 RepID=A0A3S2ULM1_9FLAO|nr:protein kinase family protein [Flavobacterium sufflavum]RVT73361.1 protein kinase family protein [Flavobacterium sufflavum]